MARFFVKNELEPEKRVCQRARYKGVKKHLLIFQNGGGTDELKMIKRGKIFFQELNNVGFAVFSFKHLCWLFFFRLLSAKTKDVKLHFGLVLSLLPACRFSEKAFLGGQGRSVAKRIWFFRFIVAS